MLGRWPAAEPDEVLHLVDGLGLLQSSQLIAQSLRSEW